MEISLHPILIEECVVCGKEPAYTVEHRYIEIIKLCFPCLERIEKEIVRIRKEEKECPGRSA